MSDLDDVDEEIQDFDEAEERADAESLKVGTKEAQRLKLEMRRKVEDRMLLRQMRDDLGDPDFDYDYL